MEPMLTYLTYIGFDRFPDEARQNEGLVPDF